MNKFAFFLLAGCFITSISTAQSRLEFSHYTAYNKVEFDYTVLTPKSYDKTEAYPVLFAFSSGEQDREAIEWAAEHMWGDAFRQDWLIILPTIPEQSWHTHPSHHALEAFLDQFKKDYNVKDDTFHLAGFGEGSRAAITYANMSNAYFSSLTVANPNPWSRWEDRDLKRWTQRNKHISFRILVGENDDAARTVAEHVEGIFERGGIDLKLIVLEGEGEHLKSVQGGRMLKEVERTAGVLPASAQEATTLFKELSLSNSRSIPYAVHLPEGYEASKTYPVLIGPGDATEGADPGFYWSTDPYSHGWIIVDARIWEKPTTEHLDGLLDKVLEEYNVEGGKFHTVCWSANSAGIFNMAIAHADRFHSITGMAGNPGRLSGKDVESLASVRVQFVVGSKDTYWLRSAKKSHERLAEGGVHTELEVVDGEEHVMRSLIGKGFMEKMERMR